MVENINTLVGVNVGTALVYEGAYIAFLPFSDKKQTCLVLNATTPFTITRPTHLM